jgi:outer membrane protein OmpA-like peptidoglycan-associated protein
MPAPPPAPAWTVPGGPGPGVQPVEAARHPDPAAGFLPSLDGPIGLYRVSTAEVGPVQHLRLALHGKYFRATDFLVPNDTNTRLDGAFTFGYTPHESIELFGAFLTASNRNERPSDPTGDRRDPELIKSFGDLVLGGKGVLPVGRGFTAGAELGFRFLSSVSDLSFSPSSTSLWIGPVATADLRTLAQVPLRVHANASFYLDNSGNLYDFNGTTLATREVAMFAYGIVGSRLRFALGADAPLEHLRVPLRPFAEYHAELITASRDPSFSMLPGPKNRDQHWLTFGLRGRVARGLSLDAGMDIGLRSVGYEYGTPIAPWAVIFGASYALDLEALNREVVVTKTVETAVPTTTGTVAGAIKATDGKPVGDAVVAFGTRPRSRVVSDADGGFESGPLAGGPVEVVATAPGFEPGRTTAVVVPGTPVMVEMTLTRKAPTGNVRGKVSDRGGRGVGATLRFSGAATYEAHADATGTFSAALPVGPYKVVVEAPGFPNKEVPLDIVAGEDKHLDVALRPANPDVVLTDKSIVLKVPIKFPPGTPKLNSTVKAELDGVADLLLDHPEVKTLRIEAHWNRSGPGPKKKKGTADVAKKLTARQANTVRDYLIAKGVPAGRIEATARGSEAPLVPNLGPASQLKNRRVELVVVQ